jgi:hypothetical protein
VIGLSPAPVVGDETASRNKSHFATRRGATHCLCSRRLGVLIDAGSLTGFQVSGSIGEPDVDSLARELESYVASHPSAADTLECIARWWLKDAVQPSLSRVEAALDLLASRGIVARFPLPDGRFVYQRARQDSQAAAARSSRE